MPLDDIDKKLLTLIQRDFPIASEPYSQIAFTLGISEDEVINRLANLKEEGIIRRIGAIFDSKKLGYHSTLCAMKVPEERIDEVADIVNGYPGVTHNYLRADEYNMWFTLIAKSQEELKRIIGEIKDKSQISDLIDLPATGVFKIRVHFAVNGLSTDSGNGLNGLADDSPEHKPNPLNPFKKSADSNPFKKSVDS